MELTLTGLLVFIIANQLGFDGIWNGIFPWLELEKTFFMVDLPIIYQATEEDHWKIWHCLIKINGGFGKMVIKWGDDVQNHYMLG